MLTTPCPSCVKLLNTTVCTTRTCSNYRPPFNKTPIWQGGHALKWPYGIPYCVHCKAKLGDDGATAIRELMQELWPIGKSSSCTECSRSWISCCNWVCSLDAGHSGPHVAYGASQPLAVWHSSP